MCNGTIKGFSRCARITVTLVFEPGAFESRSDCACATYPSVGHLPHRRNTKVSQTVLVFPVWEELLDIAEGAQELCLRSSVTSWRYPKPCPSPQESECLRKFILAENESDAAADRAREVSDPTESASTSAVRSSSIFSAATLRCFGHMIVLHTRQHARGRLSVRKTSPEDYRKSPPLEENRRDSESFG